MSGPDQRTVDLPSGRFSYLDAGDADAPVALCLHGFPDHAPSWLPVMTALVDAGYRAIAPWMRGYAPSTPSGPFNSDRLGLDACELADVLAPGRKVALVGHDWGAVATYRAIAARPATFSSAVTMAMPHPLAFVRNLARYPSQLRRSWYMMFFQLPVAPERVIPARNYAFIDRLWRSWSPSLRVDPNAMAELKACLAQSMPAPLEYYRAMPGDIGKARQLAAEARSNPITVPTLCLQGDEDGCIAGQLSEGQSRVFAGEYRAEIVGGTGHFLHVEAPARVARLALDWLREHPA